MAGNSYGKTFKLTTFGESHGTAIGGIIDGCPAGIELNLDEVQRDLDRRRPGQSDLTTPRNESDKVEWLSGIFEGKSTGTPIAFIIYNKDYRSRDYSDIKDVFRPSHADFVYAEKYGIRDYRGGGRSSARETASRVAAGGIAKQLLGSKGVEIRAFVSQIGKIKADIAPDQINLDYPENELRCPDEKAAVEMRKLLELTKTAGDTLGGVITCLVKNVPVGLGEPVFDKLHAELGKAMLSINAVKGFEIGSGFSAVEMKGSEHNDSFEKTEKGVRTKTNFSGGIQGGISNGMDILFRVAFKPVASIAKAQKTISDKGEDRNIEVKGRHDPCVVPRAVPIVEAMAALVLADFELRNRASTL